MGILLQQLVVAALVLVALVYSAWRLLGAARRLRVVNAVGPLTPGVLKGAVARLRARALAELSVGCGACPGRGGPASTRSAGALRR